MFKLFLSPKDYAKDHLVRYTDLCSEEHFDRHKDKILPRIKVNAARKAYGHMMKFDCDVYVFSEQELIDLVKKIKGN
jgi:hypothetical protein